MTFYDEDTKKRAAHHLKWGRVGLYASFGALPLTVALSIILATRGNRPLSVGLGSGLSVLFSVILAFFFPYVLFQRKIKKHLKAIETGERQTLSSEVISFSRKPITQAGGLRAYEAKLSFPDGHEGYAYLLASFNARLQEKQTYDFVLSGDYIVEAKPHED